VTRHGDDDFAARAAWALATSSRPIPVITGGSGRTEHPTQALLDIYTLARAYRDRGGLDHRRVLLVGDIGRNRAARSLATMLSRFEVDRIDVACTESHPPEPAFVAALQRRGTTLDFHPDVESALRTIGHDLDAVYMTRLQQEWDAQASAELGASEGFILKAEYRTLVRDDCQIMHPLPRVNELPDTWADHEGFAIWHQVRNGMWVRAALLATMFGADELLATFTGGSARP
jgi:aspartate carbamoyltransferase catalytic subunit